MSNFPFFDEYNKLQKLSQLGDILEKLNAIVNWNIFIPILNEAIPRETNIKGGRPPFNNLLMFKILIIKVLYNLSFDQVEYQINDRLSFMRFLGFDIGSQVPDAKTIWLYEDLLSKSDSGKQLFNKFFEIIDFQGYVTKTGSIVDATFIETPRRKNTQEQRETLKNGNIPSEWNDPNHPQKLLQRDIDATWAMQGNEVHFGYKDHIKIDNDSKLIVDYNISTASSNDHKGAVGLFTGNDKVAYGDSAYSNLELPYGVKNMLHEKGNRNNPLTEEQIKNNQIKSKLRCRVEHVFAGIVKMFNGTNIRCKSFIRASFNISLLNLLYNMRRILSLKRLSFKCSTG
ncbi:MAG: IS5 family transposase [Bacteroidales bacterium]|jgi:IS5 family transposase|nr:IS5 family transposase [Bacteroidales bacterium]